MMSLAFTIRWPLSLFRHKLEEVSVNDVGSRETVISWAISDKLFCTGDSSFPLEF
nr:MAG TPA: hypothetical protein [Caudoviricetes sp.]